MTEQMGTGSIIGLIVVSALLGAAAVGFYVSERDANRRLAERNAEELERQRKKE